MIRSFVSLRGCTVSANDGSVGELGDVFFHDGLWLVRRLAVYARDCPRPLLVPVSPACRFDSSGIQLGVPMAALPGPGMAADLSARSARSLSGYLIEAADGLAGRLDDFILSDAGWWIPSLVINTQTLLPGKVHVVPSVVVRAIDPIHRRLRLRTSREAIGRLPVWAGAPAIDAVH